MSNKEQQPVVQPEGELSDQQLDNVSGGQQIVKLDKVTVTAKREPPLSGTQIASAAGVTKKN